MFILNNITMRKILILVTTFLFISFSPFAQLRVQNLLCENLSNPLGLGILHPRFSWQLISDRRNTLQTAYEVTVSNTTGKSVKPLWSSGKVVSPQSVYVPYSGSALEPNHTYYWGWGFGIIPATPLHRVKLLFGKQAFYRPQTGKQNGLNRPVPQTQ